jgi:acyl-CoA synthetase (NDP forming)
LRAAVADDGVDAVMVVFAPALATSGADFAHVIREVTDGCGKPVASTFLAAEGVPQQLRRLGPTGAPVRGSVPSYPSPERAVIALTDVDTGTAKAVVAGVLADDPAGRELTRDEVGRLLAAYGIGLSPAMAPDGVAIVVDVTDDPTFGALVSFGVGGVATELLGDRAYAPTPISDLDAARLVRAPRAAPLLSGYRGAEPVDLGAAEDLVVRVGRLAEELPEVLSLTLDPVLVAGCGLTVLAATARIGPATARADVGPRRLR